MRPRFYPVASGRPDLVGDQPDVIDEPVIAVRNRDEARSLRELPARLPPPPGLVDAVERHALVLRAHQDRDPLRRRLPVDLQLRHLLEEAPMDRESPGLDRGGKSGIGSPGASFSSPARAESRARARSGRAALRGPLRLACQRDQRAERAADDDRRADRLAAASRAASTIASKSSFSKEGRFRSGATRRNSRAESASRSSAILRPAGDEANPCRYSTVPMAGTILDPRPRDPTVRRETEDSHDVYAGSPRRSCTGARRQNNA